MQQISQRSDHHMHGLKQTFSPYNCSFSFGLTIATVLNLVIRAHSVAEKRLTDYFASRYWLLESVLVLTADVSLLWLLLSPVDGAGALLAEFGLASITSRCAVAELLCAADAAVLTGMPSNCCLLTTHTANTTSPPSLRHNLIPENKCNISRWVFENMLNIVKNCRKSCLRNSRKVHGSYFSDYMNIN